MIQVKEVSFKLNHPIKYHESGQIEEAYELIMRSPTMSCYKAISMLKAGLFKKIESNRDKYKDESPKDKTADDITGEALIAMLYSGGDMDMNDYLESFNALILAGCVVLRGDTGDIKISRAQITSMDPEDYERLAGEYLLNFILGSLFQKKNLK